MTSLLSSASSPFPPFNASFLSSELLLSLTPFVHNYLSLRFRTRSPHLYAGRSLHNFFLSHLISMQEVKDKLLEVETGYGSLIKDRTECSLTRKSAIMSAAQVRGRV